MEAKMKYWNQWDHTELMSMQGIEIEEKEHITMFDEDFEDDLDLSDIDLDGPQPYDCLFEP